METVTLAYGDTTRTLEVPDKTAILQHREPRTIISATLFRQRLNVFFSTHPLNLDRPVLVVADKTRLCGYPEYLPVLVAALEAQGMDRNRLKIIIAYGTHTRQSDEECLQAYGPIYRELSFIHHDCSDDDTFVTIGTTSRRTPIRFRRDLFEASAVIIMGAICHHYFAGYGGGRKLVFPGCGEKEAIYANHGLYLDHDSSTLAPACQPGVLTGNPLAEDLFDIENARSADLSIHGILDGTGRLCNLLVGKGRELFTAACADHGAAFEIDSPAFDTVIASCGGYPKDINFIQSHKSVHNSSMFVDDGGLLLVYCQCRDGIGSTTFLPWFDFPSFNEAFQQLARKYEGNGGTALATMVKRSRIRIGLVTSLAEEVCQRMGLEKWSHHEVQEYVRGLPAGTTLGCITNGSMLVRKSAGPQPWTHNRSA